MLNLRIVSPESIAYNGEAESVKVPGMLGSFEILNNHAPIISALTKGTLRVVTDGDETKLFEIRGGVVKGQKNDILILVQ